MGETRYLRKKGRDKSERRKGSQAICGRKYSTSKID